MSRSLQVMRAGLVLAWVLGGRAVLAGTINVPAQYATIQTAIDAAAAGDVVMVAKGTYRENLDFKGKAITVRGTNPLDKSVVAATIVDGSQAGSVVTFTSGEGATSVLKGLTLTNGSGTSSTFGALGGGIYCVGSSPVITRVNIKNNAADHGAGMYCSGASPSLSYSTISSNVAARDGGGLSCEALSAPVVDNTTISNNQATGLTGSGAGVYCHNSSPTLTVNVITGNSASFVGGGVYCNGCSPTLTNNVIAGNSASGRGGGLCCTGASPSLVNNTLSDNSSSQGGGIYCENASAPYLKNDIIALNTAGAGLYVLSAVGVPVSSPVISYCDLYGNTGGNYVNCPNPIGRRGNVCRNPLFVNAGRGDFHLKSTAGRWDPRVGVWVIDAYHSRCIDAGSPRSSFRFEPAPNGGCINMGAYGNTRQASKSAPVFAPGAVLVTATAVPTADGRAQLTVKLTSEARVQVTVLNLAGRPVAALPEQTLPQGVHNLSWNGLSSLGTKAPAGQYLMRVTARGAGGDQAQALTGLCLRR